MGVLVGLAASAAQFGFELADSPLQVVFPPIDFLEVAVQAVFGVPGEYLGAAGAGLTLFQLGDAPFVEVVDDF